jgi:DNA-binding response OmpR family regulator
MIRLLIVEDEPLLALDLEAQLEDAGYSNIDIATNVADALQIIRQNTPDVAVLDINLGTETSELVGKMLRAQDLPFVVISAYSDSINMPVFADAPRLVKPVRIHLLLDMLKRCVKRRD